MYKYRRNKLVGSCLCICAVLLSPQTPKTEWGTPLASMQNAIALERRVNDQLLDLHWMAQDKNDPHVSNLASSYVNVALCGIRGA